MNERSVLYVFAYRGSLWLHVCERWLRCCCRFFAIVKGYSDCGSIIFYADIRISDPFFSVTCSEKIILLYLIFNDFV